MSNKATGDGERPVDAGVFGLPAHRARAAAIGEVHARPFPVIPVPRCILQLTCMTEDDPERDTSAVASLCRQAGVAPPDDNTRHVAFAMAGGSLRWERHGEFSTYRFDALLPASGALPEHPFGSAFPVPGRVISAVRLDVRRHNAASDRLVEAFDPASLCRSTVDGGKAEIITDFRQDGDGLTRMLILDKGLSPARIGALSQRLIEIETYRTLALVGFPDAQALSAPTRALEDDLAVLTARMRSPSRDNEALLADITALSARIEAQSSAHMFRFAASRAYYDIVEQRLAAINEGRITGIGSWGGFLRRRVAPAMRTIASLEARQETLSRKLARASTLLRSWVEVDLQRQNGELLAAMNRRATQQLRLQQTVEGLSVAAVSYYVVGLASYVFKLVEKETGLSSTLLTAAVVPFALLAVWMTVRRIRRAHAGT